MDLSPESHALLMTLLDTPAPSGFTTPAAKVFLDYAGRFAHAQQDELGNVWAHRGPGTGRRIAIFAHLDEIGLIVTRIDDDGFIRVEPIGSWDPAVLVGQRVQILAAAGDVDGVIARPPIHMLRTAGTEQQVTPITDLWIDIAVADAEEARQLGVEDQQFGLNFQAQGHGALSVAALAHELIIRVETQDFDEHLPNRSLVFDDDETLHGA